jgi:hypothetical protein
VFDEASDLKSIEGTDLKSKTLTELTRADNAGRLLAGGVSISYTESGGYNA